MISVKMDVSKFVKDLDRLGLSQIPYAMQLGINDTLLDIQQEERDQIAGGEFTLRKTQWVLNTVKIGRGDFATKSNLRGRIGIGGGSANPETSKNEGLLAKFEEEGVKESLDPSFPIAIPSQELRPSFAELVPHALFPKALRLVERRTASGTLAPNRHVTRSGVVQLKGKLRTFVLDPKTMHGVSAWAVYQRTGSGRGDIRMLWRYKTRVRIPHLLHFYDTAARVIDDRFGENFSHGFFKAITTAR